MTEFPAHEQVVLGGEIMIFVAMEQTCNCNCMETTTIIRKLIGFFFNMRKEVKIELG